jgi:glucosyl-3-phosphoglycerate synthase
MYGQVTRLFISPVIRALKKIFGHLPFLVYLDGSGILAGEFSMKQTREEGIPADWGLEVGSLARRYSGTSRSRGYAQVDLRTITSISTSAVA